MTADAALADLLAETRQLVSGVPELARFVGDDLQNLQVCRQPARKLPMVPQLDALMAQTRAETAGVTRAVLAAASYVHWQQSYSEAQVGAEYLTHYGWFNLVSPEGPYLSERLGVSVGYWGQGLTYPQHQHQPEEIYCVLAGAARFASEGVTAQEGSPGGLIHHATNQMHGFSVDYAPLLAMAFWRGDALLEISSFAHEATS